MLKTIIQPVPRFLSGVDNPFDIAGSLDKAKLTAMFASLPVGVVVHGLDGRVVLANASALEILGLSRAEIIGKTSMEPDWQAVREDGSHFPGHEHPAMTCLVTGQSVSGVTMGVYSRKWGRHRWIMVDAKPLVVDNQRVGAYACFKDITDRKAIEAQLEDVRERLELALIGADLGTYNAYLPTGEVKVNARYLAILGYGPGELAMSVAEWIRRIHPENLPRIQAYYGELVDSTARFVDIEYRLHHKDGHWVWLQDRGRVFEADAAGHPVRVIGTQMDITARKHAEIALRESEARYRKVVETSPVGIMILMDQQVVMANPACLRLYRAVLEEDLLGREIWPLTSPKSHELLRQRIARAMVHGKENPIAEIEILRLDGTTLPVDGVSVPIEYHGRRAIHVMIYNSTWRRQAEALLRQQHAEAESMLSLQVAYRTLAGMAHELNQPLNVLTTLGVAAERQLDQLADVPPRFRETVAAMTTAARRSGGVLNSLIDALRKPTVLRGTAEVDKLVREVIRQVEATLPHKHALDVRMPSEPLWVSGHQAQLENVMLNLVRNAIEACQAVHDRGTPARVLIEASVVNSDVLLCVTDNGPGVEPEQLPKLFQPFSSAKPSGIGMGLAIGRSLVESLDGRMWHEPAPGGGSRFCIRLPRARLEPAGEVS